MVETGIGNNLKMYVLSVTFFSVTVVKSHKSVTFFLLCDAHLGKSHLSCCCEEKKLMILRDTQREMCEFPPELYPYPTAFQRMSLEDKMNHLGQK